jgi:5-methylcytosine-specific restriction endonuclease McrA
MNTPALKRLSSKALLAQIEKIRRREHLSTIEILLHLNELEHRKLHLTLGYSSLYDYCVKHLGYSSSGATRRVAVARCVRRHPEVLGLLRSRRLTVSGVSLIASALTNENKAELLTSIQGKTQSQIEAIASRYRPAIAFKDRVQTVKVVVPHSPKAPGNGLAVPHSPKAPGNGLAVPHSPKAPGNGSAAPAEPGDGRQNSQNHEAGSFAQNGQSVSVSVCAAETNKTKSARTLKTEQRLLVQFLANEAFMEKLERVRALLSQRLSDPSFANVFEALMNEFIERHSPEHRKARRDQRKDARWKTRGKRTSRESSSPANAPRSAQMSCGVRPKRRSRHIPAPVRDEVFARDQGRCTYKGKTGKRCGSTQALQIDHIQPFARGGSNDVSNLRLLCAKHNRLAAEEVYGANVMKRFEPGNRTSHHWAPGREESERGAGVMRSVGESTAASDP